MRQPQELFNRGAAPEGDPASGADAPAPLLELALAAPVLPFEPEPPFAPLVADTPDAAVPEADPLLLAVVPASVVPEEPPQDGCAGHVSLMLCVTVRTLESSD